MKLLAPVLAFTVLLAVGGCPAPEEPAAPPRDPARPTPAEPAIPRDSTTQTTPSQPRANDQEIQQQLKMQIQQDQTLSQVSQQVTIEVRNGVVTLRGNVHSQEESRRIEELALQAPGVQDVNNQLQVTMDDSMDEPVDPYGDPS